jgi:hypothetical protein
MFTPSRRTTHPFWMEALARTNPPRHAAPVPHDQVAEAEPNHLQPESSAAQPEAKAHVLQQRLGLIERHHLRIADELR